MTLTKKVVLVTTVTATAPIIENRFIGFDGAQAKANAPVFGVTPREADKGDSVSVECRYCVGRSRWRNYSRRESGIGRARLRGRGRK
ncbi:hypothetical protein [Simonsiella muelleri]|uniref:hypothetical protein n=1 Tax=Simonsiella muelleri TaxID=72 RepID=UPI0028D5EE13|nr:hypothetical protein [Simonsiella muelleri]